MSKMPAAGAARRAGRIVPPLPGGSEPGFGERPRRPRRPRRHAPAPSASELSPHFPQLQILELIGQGGMGMVYKVRQKELDRIAALKILPPGTGADPAFAERFSREAKALAKLNHPGIVTIYDFGRADGLFYFLMEFVDGVSLRQLMRAGRMPPREALAIVPQLCEALQCAHDQGIVHRDIKPENILLDRQGRVKVADFGLAKLVGAETREGCRPPATSTTAGDAARAAAGVAALTDAVKVMGTPHYMAPEQAEHPTEVDHRADIYALGVVFYQMLTGELPGKHLEPPSKKVRINVRLDEVVLRALEKEPERRYQQVSEVKTDLDTIAATPGSAAAAAPPLRNPRINGKLALALYSLQAALVVPLEWCLIHHEWNGFLIWLSLAFPAFVSAYLAWARLHYLCWRALPEKSRATTPGEAVGFLFIPFFNFYWGFISFPKLAGGFNALQAEHPELGLRNMKALGVAKAILFVCVWTIAFIPGLNAIFCLADLVVFVLFYRGIIGNANRWATGMGAAEKGVESDAQRLDQAKTAEKSIGGAATPDTFAAPSKGRAGRPTGGWPRFAFIGVIGGIAALLASWFCLRLLLRSPGPPAGNTSRDAVLEVTTVTVLQGDIGVRLACLGTVASSNSVIFSISEDDCQEVIRRFDAHQALPVDVYDRKMAKFGHGLVVGIDNLIDPTAGTLKGRASVIPDSGGLMLPWRS